ncbi:unnamed protein product [Rotaria socialis]|uniref:C-type lectin domain-containing protein n=1 Tax=Rotaria socialis TaxID=392032 RepID=A0A820VSY1_9BILA|nr:unnamed protein product [Rotaria socialis]CAF4504665.1 unnamed protein product [Rotaria socialis]CAF4609025.1 unnamed protein product [Rotaria socialis]
MYEFFYLSLFYQVALALVYNDPCTDKCNLPGMICMNNKCKCDSKNRRFWTGARCSFCPTDWSMAETACIAYYHTSMTWQNAEATCRNMNASLISIRNKNMFSLIYDACRKKDGTGVDQYLKGWTSAHGTSVSGSGVYEWLDKSLPSFNDKSDLWCKKTTANLGYVYVYDEPTKLIGDGSEVESCSGFWRGRTSVYVVCLDDQLCSRPYPFICEKTEYTENIFGGAPPVTSRYLLGATHSNSQFNESHNNGISTTANPKKKSSGILIIVGIVVLVLLALVGGILYFLKFRNSTGAQKKRQTNGGASREESIRSDEYTNEGELNVDRHPAPAHRDLTTIDEKKPKQDKRGGYSKQQFDEFE